MTDVTNIESDAHAISDAADFEVVQEYHSKRQHRHIRYFHTWGLARTGLEVTKNLEIGQETKVVVSAGIALDNEGREIVLPEPRPWDFNQPRFEGGKSYYLIIGRQEQQVLSEQDNEPKRWVENPYIDALEAMPERPGMELVLARVMLKADKSIDSIDGSVRKYATFEIEDRKVTSVKIAEADNTSGQDINVGDGIKTAHLQDEAVTEEKLNKNIKAKLVTNGDSHIHSAQDVGALPITGGTISSGLSTQGGQVRRDFLTWNTSVRNSAPVHIKTNIPKKSNIMYRFLVEGYNYGMRASIFSDVVGYTYAGSDAIIEAQANNYANGVSISQYYSSDDFVVIKLTTSDTYYLGFSVSAWFTNPTGTAWDISAVVFHQQGNL